MVDPGGMRFSLFDASNSVLKLNSWIIVSNRSSNSLKNLRALCLREENDECWGCRKSGSRNGGRVILQTGLRSTRHRLRLGYAASYKYTVRFHNHRHLDRF